MNREDPVVHFSDRKRLKAASSEIAQAVCFWMFEFAESDAAPIANHEFQVPFEDGDDLRRSLVRDVYRHAQEKIQTILSQNGLTHYQEDVKQVCVDELSESYDELIGRFSGTRRPGPVELAIEEAAKPTKAALAAALLGTLTALEEDAERQRQLAAEQRRLRSLKRSRSWWSAVKDFFSW